MKSCTLCEIILDDDEYFYDNLYCEVCWSEKVCNVCGIISSNIDYTYCEKCQKHLSDKCSCSVIRTPQYHGSICRECFHKGIYNCYVCGIDLYNFVKQTSCCFCEENTYFNDEKYNGLICRTCINANESS